MDINNATNTITTIIDLYFKKYTNINNVSDSDQMDINVTHNNTNNMLPQITQTENTDLYVLPNHVLI